MLSSAEGGNHVRMVTARFARSFLAQIIGLPITYNVSSQLSASSSVVFGQFYLKGNSRFTLEKYPCIKKKF